MDLTEALDLITEHDDARHEGHYDAEGCRYPGCEEAFALFAEYERPPMQVAGMALDLIEDLVQPVWATEGTPLRWWTFHVKHREVGSQLLDMTDALMRNGHRRLSIKMLWESLRFKYLVGSRPDEPGPRFNNNYTAYYARWLMETYPGLRGVFSTRGSEAEV